VLEKSEKKEKVNERENTSIKDAKSFDGHREQGEQNHTKRGKGSEGIC
jgi:hypothetical protein